MNSNSVDILLVEDSAADVELTLRALSKHNLENQVQVVRDGAEALEFLFGTGSWAGRSVEDGPRLILLDLKLPKVDGLEVLRQIKSDPRTRSIPVVALTSSQEESDITQSYDLGVNSYVVKPVNFARFADAIGNVGLYWLLLNQPPPT